MLYINAVDGSDYLIRKEEVFFVKKNGDKLYIYVYAMVHPVVSSMTIEKITSLLARDKISTVATPLLERNE